MQAWLESLAHNCGGCAGDNRRAADADARRAQQSPLVQPWEHARPRPLTYPCVNSPGSVSNSRLHTALHTSLPLTVDPAMSEASSFTSSPSNRSTPKGILRNVSFKARDDERSTRSGSDSASTSVSIDSQRNEDQSDRGSYVKTISNRLLEVNKQIRKQESLIEHYQNMASRPGISFEDKTKTMDKVKQLRALLADRSRKAEGLKDEMRAAEKAKSLMRNSSPAVFERSSSSRILPSTDVKRQHTRKGPDTP